jgi:hypothetical protein
VSKIGWLIAVAAGLFAGFLATRNFALSTTVQLLRTEVELAQVDVQSLKQQLEAERILARREMADLSSKGQIEPLTFVRLSSSEKDTAGFSATIVWRPSAQTGVFFSEQLPLPASDEHYQLWIETSTGITVSAGTLAVGQNLAKAEFKAAGLVERPVRFTVTREHQNAPDRPSGPIVLIGSL